MEIKFVTLVFLIVLCLLLFFTLLILVCIIWKRFKLQNNGKKYKLLKPPNKTDDERFIENKFKLPMSTWTIPVQTEVTDKYSDLSMHHNKPRSHSSTSGISSIIFEEEEFEIRNKLEDQERRISEGVLEHLIKQGRRVSTADLRTNSKKTPITSQSSIQEDDLFDSSTMGTKHRICKRKRLKRTNAFGGIGHDTQKRFKKAGAISFTIEYFPEEEKLDIEIQNVSVLASRLTPNEINLFLSIYLKPGKKQKQQTSVRKGTKEPVFEETISFQKLKKDELIKTLLKINVMNQENLKKNEKVGEVGIAMSSINIRKKEKFNTELFIKRMDASFSSVCIGLCHKAASSKLEVTVNVVKNLPKCGMLGVYASILLFRSSKLIQKQTSIKRNTRDPQFNETLEFDVYTDILTPLTTHSVVVTINSQNFGKDEVIGHVIFNVMSPQKSAVEQWMLVQNDPHQCHVGWHSLVNPDDL